MSSIWVAYKKIINLNNAALGMVKQWQDMQYGGRHSSSTYENSLPDFVALTESYGHVGIKVSKFDELESAMKECISLKDKLVFLDVDVDPNEHVYPMLGAGNAMDHMRLSKDEKTGNEKSNCFIDGKPTGALSRVVGLFLKEVTTLRR